MDNASADKFCMIHIIAKNYKKIETRPSAPNISIACTQKNKPYFLSLVTPNTCCNYRELTSMQTSDMEEFLSCLPIACNKAESSLKT